MDVLSNGIKQELTNINGACCSPPFHTLPPPKKGVFRKMKTSDFFDRKCRTSASKVPMFCPKKSDVFIFRNGVIPTCRQRTAKPYVQYALTSGTAFPHAVPAVCFFYRCRDCPRPCCNTPTIYRYVRGTASGGNHRFQVLYYPHLMMSHQREGRKNGHICVLPHHSIPRTFAP